MSFSSGIISGDANVAVTLRGVIHDMLVAHPAWEYVEEAVGVAVYRCKGTHNLKGADFYIGLQASAANITYSAFEEWNTVTKKCRRPVPNQAASNPVAADASVGNGTEYTVQTDTTQVWNAVYALSTTQTDYRLLVTNDALVALTNSSGVGGALYLGMFEPFLPDYVNEFPLLMMDLLSDGASNSTTKHAWSRHPRKENAGASLQNFKGFTPTSGFDVRAQNWTPVSGVPGSGVDAFAGVPVLARMLVSAFLSSTTYALRGLMPTSILLSAGLGSISWGDTLTVNGRVCTPTTVPPASTGRRPWIDTEA